MHVVFDNIITKEVTVEEVGRGSLYKKHAVSILNVSLSAYRVDSA